MKQFFLMLSAAALLAGPALAQEKPGAKKKAPAQKEEACNKGKDASCCKQETAAKGKSCCMPMPSRAEAAKAAAKKKAAEKS
ncbi:hypothetical protein WJU16_13115 [Chitinophaga pollutisoli]|uniref:Uncharacterized protein n=1 Tax=Chitinophaga pollutisoli TaxID=3133966 RepID=A0ABZ2YGH3_9BACT